MSQVNSVTPHLQLEKARLARSRDGEVSEAELNPEPLSAFKVYCFHSFRKLSQICVSLRTYTSTRPPFWSLEPPVALKECWVLAEWKPCSNTLWVWMLALPLAAYGTDSRHISKPYSASVLWNGDGNRTYLIAPLQKPSKKVYVELKV